MSVVKNENGDVLRYSGGQQDYTQFCELFNSAATKKRLSRYLLKDDGMEPVKPIGNMVFNVRQEVSSKDLEKWQQKQGEWENKCKETIDLFKSCLSEEIKDYLKDYTDFTKENNREHLVILRELVGKGFYLATIENIERAQKNHYRQSKISVLLILCN